MNGAPSLVNTADLSIEQVRSTLQLINKMLRKQAQPNELKALLNIKEVRDILGHHKANPKEAGERINQYQKELASRLRAHDRGKRPADEQTANPEEGLPTSVSKRSKPGEDGLVVPEAKEAERVLQPTKARRSVQLSGMLSQSELAVPPSGPPPKEFNVEWIQYFFELMCSRVPFFSDRKLLIPAPSRLYVEESEEQRVFIDGLSNSELILLLNFVYDLESNLLTKKSKSVLIPNRFVFIPSMGDPLESGLLESWYYSNTCQCATCALRFANRKLLTIHHDYHYQKYTAYQRRKRGLENNFRGWMEVPVEWLGNKSMEFSTTLYGKLDLGISAFFGSSSGEGECGDENSQPQKISSGSHAARTFTDMQHLSEQILPESVPVDEIKANCLECGERFDKAWIGHPVNMAVFQGVLALSFGGVHPLQFAWPVAAATTEDLDDDEEEVGKPTHAIEAGTAQFDPRFLNALLLHKTCFENNPKLTNKDYQHSLLFGREHVKLLARILPAKEQPPIEQQPTVMIQEEDEEDDEEMNIS